jgi:hypothetical protein
LRKGDEPLFGFPQKGTVTGLDKMIGKILWQTETAVGEWVTGANASKNGGATVWSSGAIDLSETVCCLYPQAIYRFRTMAAT